MPFPTNLDAILIDCQAIFIINAFWGQGQSAAAYSWALNLWGAPQRGFQVNSNNASVSMLCVEYPNAVVYLFGGADRRQHLEGYKNGLNWDNVVVWGTNDVNAFVTPMAENVYAAINTNGITKSKPQLLFGHSLGGCVAQYLALGMRALGTFNLHRVSTFGSPKWCRQMIADSYGGIATTRWMNLGDPIPRIWPSQTESPALALVVAGSTAISGARMTHTLGGCVVREDATVYLEDMPPMPAGGIPGALMGWWWAMSGDTMHPHHAMTYYDRLTRYNASINEPDINKVPRTNNALHSPPAPTERELDQIREEQIRNIADGADGLAARGFAAGTTFWRYRKENGLYKVYLNDNFVCAFKGRGKAKKMVAGGNKMCNNYLRSAIGDGEQLDFAIDMFTDAMDMGDL